MSKLEGKELSYGVLAATVFVPGVGNFGPTLTNQDSATHKAVKMVVDEPFVTLSTKDKVGKEVSIAVPITYFTHMVVAK